MNDHLAVAGIWGPVFFAVTWLFVEPFGLPTAAVAISAIAGGFLAAAAGSHLAPYIFPPEEPSRSDAP